MNRRELIRVLSGGIAGIPAVDSVNRLTVQPEDIVVLKYKGHMDYDSMVRLREQFNSKFPGLKVMVIDQDLDISVIRKA